MLKAVHQKRTWFVLSAAVWLILAYIPSSAYAESWPGKVVGISDGDTITVMHDNQSIKVRLVEIDCPETGQAFGRAAKRLTSNSCFSKVVMVEAETADRYGCTVAHVKLPDGHDLSEELLGAGLAWHYKKYSGSQAVAKLESEPRAAALGIWRQKDPIAPWDWRYGAKQPEMLEAEKANQLTGTFHGNVKSKVFHRQGCRYYNCLNCTAVFDSREKAVGAGYRPCKICNP